MKKALVLVLAVLFGACNVFAAETLTVIANRKSVRNFTRGEISADVTTKILKAAMAAPSGMDKRPWHYVVVNDFTKLDELSTVTGIGMLKDASLAIIVCGDTSSKLWVMDCSASTQNILLAVEDLNLGAVWCNVYGDEKRTSDVKKMFGIPSEVMPLNIVVIGYPAKKTMPKNKYDETKIHFNNWAGK
jgi:nitroreductase